MEKKEFIIPYHSYASLSEVEEPLRTLLEEAKKATDGSYSPYSHFSVGAAILLSTGEMVRGANQENAAFSSGLCAERSACFWVGANRPGAVMEAIAIAAKGADGEFQAKPISPCGACRQALLEYEVKQQKAIRVLLYGRDEILEFPSITSLLPFTFTSF